MKKPDLIKNMSRKEMRDFYLKNWSKIYYNDEEDTKRDIEIGRKVRAIINYLIQSAKKEYTNNWKEYFNRNELIPIHNYGFGIVILNKEIGYDLIKDRRILTK